MNQRFSRRSTLRVLAVGGGILAARLGGVLPELSVLGSPGSLARSSRKNVPRPRELSINELHDVTARAEQNANVARLRQLAAREGFALRSREIVGAAIEFPDGTVFGHSTVTTLHDRARRRTARLVYQIANGDVKPALGMWDDDHPERISLYGIRSGAAQRLGTITFEDDSVVIDDIVQGRVTIPRRFPGGSVASAKGPGLAALADQATHASSETCQEFCSWVVTPYYITICEYSWFVLCSVILAVSGVPGLACFLISIATCYVAVETAREWSCNTICA